MFLSTLEPFTQNSIDFLNQIYQDEEPFTHLTYDSFVALSSNINSDRFVQDFENSIIISKAEVRAQIAYDLCDFYLYDKKYKLAKQKVIECRDNFEIMKKEYAEKIMNSNNENRFTFCTFTDEDLNGRLMALGIFDPQKAGLLYRMNDSIINGYKEIEKIFEHDNVLLEIPLVNRRIVESDLENEVERNSTKITKEALIRVAALNKIRSLVDPNDLFSFNDFLGKYGKSNGLKYILDASISHIKRSNHFEHTQLIKKMFYNILLTTGSNNVKQIDVELIEQSGILSESDLNEIKCSKEQYDLTSPFENSQLSNLCTVNEWKMSETKSKSNRNILINLLL